MASQKQLYFLIDLYRSEPDDAVMNKIHKITDELVERGELSPKAASEILSSV